MGGYSPGLHTKPVLAASQSFSSFLFLLTAQLEVSQAAALDFLQKDILKGILQLQSTECSLSYLILVYLPISLDASAFFW